LPAASAEHFDVPDLSALNHSEIDQLQAYITDLLWLQSHGTEKQFTQAYQDLWQNQWLDVPQYDYGNNSAVQAPLELPPVVKEQEEAKSKNADDTMVTKAPPEKEESKDFFGKVGAVLADIGGGIIDEAVHNPLGLLKDAAIGVGVAVGAAFLAPEIVVGAAVVGVTVGTAEVAMNSGKWLHAADVVANSSDHTEEETAAAHAELHGLGCGAAHLTVGIAGGGFGSVGVNLVKSAVAVEADSAAAAACENAERTGSGIETAAKDESSRPFEKTEVSQDKGITQEPPRPSLSTEDAFPKAITDRKPITVERMPQQGESGLGPEDKAITQERPIVIDKPEKTISIDPKERNAITQDQSILNAKRADQPIEASPAAEDVVVESPTPKTRIYKVADREYELEKKDQAWFFGRSRLGSGDVKIHVNVDSPEDLAKIQKVLIPYLEDDQFVSARVTGWKTFDPEIGLGKSEDTFVPDGKGQAAKGFTLYARDSGDSIYLGKKIDKMLMEAGLGRQIPIETGNVDTIRGLSNRVGIVRDRFNLGYPDADNFGLRLDWQLEKQITEAFGGKLDDTALRAVEKEAGLAPETLQYDDYGYLMLKLKDAHVTTNNRIYVVEAPEGPARVPGTLRDRHAIYALHRKYGIDPSITAD